MIIKLSQLWCKGQMSSAHRFAMQPNCGGTPKGGTLDSIVSRSRQN
jgi:hypothetical protein